MPLKGLIFDFDGLIIDTELPEYQAWQEIYEQYNVTLNVNIWAQVIGSSNDKFDPVTHLENLTGKSFQHQQLLAQHRSRSDQLAQNLPLLPGVLTLLKTACESGLKLAIASSSDRFWVESHLAPLGIQSYFDCVLTKDEVLHVKPDPELYQTALHCLDLQPNEAIAFEDSPNGITAACAAGLFCVAVPNSITIQLPINHASKIIGSLDNVSLQDLNSWIL